MALVTCPDCKKSFSNAASKCPTCGRPATRTFLIWALLLIVAIIVFIWVKNRDFDSLMKETDALINRSTP